LYAVSGQGELSHRRGVEQIGAGTTLVIPASEGFDVTYTQRSRLVFLAIPGGLVDSTYPMLHGPIRSVGLGAVGRAITSSLSHVPDDSDVASATALRAVVEIVAYGGRVTPSALRARAERVIEEHLGDERLGVLFVASRLGVSPRTLERAFGGGGVAHAIRDRRLETAAARLRSSSSASISRIAADVGFGSASRFAGYFRERYGVSPRAWRS
jgi:AraC-like DNA-binding protein